MEKKVAVIVALLMIVALVAGCATIMGKSGPENLSIRSTPEHATVEIFDEQNNKIFEGETPTTVSLEKKKGYFSGKKYTVKIRKSGYAEQTVTVDTKVNGWYIGGNLILGGLIGWLIVDPATEAMWTLDTNEINVTLQKAQQGQNSFELKVVLLDEVPPHLLNKMVRVFQ